MQNISCKTYLAKHILQNISCKIYFARHVLQDIPCKTYFAKHILQNIFCRRQPLTEDDLWRKMTFDGRWPLADDDLGQRMTFDRVYSILPENNVYDSSSWQPQHNWPQTGNPISCLSRKQNFWWLKKCTRQRRLNQKWSGRGIAFKRMYPARA